MMLFPYGIFFVQIKCSMMLSGSSKHSSVPVYVFFCVCVHVHFNWDVLGDVNSILAFFCANSMQYDVF